MASPTLACVLGLALALFVSPARAEFMCLSSKKANVREGAGMEHPPLWVASRFAPFKVLEWDGEWANVKDFEGDTGWVHMSVLSGAPCVVSIGKRANVREGPGVESELLWEVERGYRFRVLRREGDWLEVSDGDEVEGWIFIKVVWGNKNPEEREES